MGKREMKMPQGHGEKVRETLMGKFGEKARAWKGGNAGYVAKHSWIVKYYGKASKCENKNCSYPKLVNAGRNLIQAPKRYEWANLSGNYSRERTDYIQLCPSCHRKMDMGKMEVAL